MQYEILRLLFKSQLKSMDPKILKQENYIILSESASKKKVIIYQQFKCFKKIKLSH